MGTEVVENHAGQVASDDQLVDALLGFVNGQGFVLLTRPALPDERRAFIAQRLATPQDVLRAQVRDQLAQIIEDRSAFALSFALPPLQSSAAKLLASLEVTAVMSFTMRGLVLDYYRKFRDESAALQYAVVLLLDVKRPYGSALCRCQLSRCPRFYLARRNPRGGKENRTYCEPAHRIEAHEAGRAERARRQRARMKK